MAVLGCIGSGKSTLARIVGERLDIKVFHLDRLWWQEGTYKITGNRIVAARTMDAEAFRQLEANAVAGPRWVIDGGIANVDLRLSRADTVIFIDMPRWTCAWRVMRRHNRGRPDYPEGVTEGLGWLWLLLKWILRTWPRERRPALLAAIDTHAPNAAIHRLYRRREVRAFVGRLPDPPGDEARASRRAGIRRPPQWNDSKNH